MMLLLEASAWATMLDNSPEVPKMISHFCVVKSDLPKDVEFQFKNKSLASLIGKGSLTLSAPFEKMFYFPKSLDSKNLPVSVLTKENNYSIGYSGYDIDPYSGGNVLSQGFTEEVLLGVGGDIPLMRNSQEISPEELKNFVSIPIKFFVGDKIETNVLNVKIKIINQPHGEHYQVEKVISLKPLPSGLSISGESFYKLSRVDLFRALLFKNIGDNQIMFVKDFSQDLPDLVDLKRYVFPFYIFNNGQCYEISIDNKVIIPREEGGKEYEAFAKKYIEPLRAINTERVQKYIDNLSKKELYDLFPLGHVFKGNGRIVKDCGIKSYQFHNLFYDRKSGLKDNISRFNGRDNSIASDVIIPPETIREIEINNNGKKSKLRVLKKYFLNENWKPAHILRKEREECGVFCPKIFAEEKMKYFKNVKITYPQSIFKDEELICGMPNINGSEIGESSDDIIEEVL